MVGASAHLDWRVLGEPSSLVHGEPIAPAFASGHQTRFIGNVGAASVAFLLRQASSCHAEPLITHEAIPE